MIAFYLVSVCIVALYLLVTIVSFKETPPSISETYYMWKEVGKQWMFTTMMWLVGLTILTYWLYASQSYRCQFLPFLSISGMMFVGGACMFKETLTKEVHYVSAFIWAGCALMFFLINSLYYPILIGIGVGMLSWMFIDRCRNLTFWAEIACVIMMIVGIGIL